MPMAAHLPAPVWPMAEVPVPRWSFRTLALVWSVPTLLGVPFATASLDTAPAGLAPRRVLVVLTVTWQVWALLTVAVLAIVDRLPVGRPRAGRAMAVHLAAHLAASLATCAAQALASAAAPPVVAPAVAPSASLVARIGLRELVIPLAAVIQFEADGVYTAAHVAGRRHLVRRSLDDLERVLGPSHFVRVHRSYLVRRSAVLEARLSAGGRRRELVLPSGTTVPVSRRRQAAVARALRA